MATIAEQHLVGGNAALDFANTVGSHSSEHPNDYLRTYEDLLIWCARAGVLTAEQARTLRRRAGEEPAGAALALKKAGRLRESIYRLFMALARGEPAPRAELERFNSFLEGAFGHARIVYRGEAPGAGQAYPGGAFGLDFDPAGRLDGMLAVIAWSAIELLRSSDIGRVKTCGNDTCGWLFVDRSKNRSRRWCEMSDCGNNEKARRFVARRKGGAGGQLERGRTGGEVRRGGGKRRAHPTPAERPAHLPPAESHGAAEEDRRAVVEDRPVPVEED